MEQSLGQLQETKDQTEHQLSDIDARLKTLQANKTFSCIGLRSSLLLRLTTVVVHEMHFVHISSQLRAMDHLLQFKVFSN